MPAQKRPRSGGKSGGGERQRKAVTVTAAAAGLEKKTQRPKCAVASQRCITKCRACSNMCTHLGGTLNQDNPLFGMLALCAEMTDLCAKSCTFLHRNVPEAAAASAATAAAAGSPPAPPPALSAAAKATVSNPVTLKEYQTCASLCTTCAQLCECTADRMSSTEKPNEVQVAKDLNICAQLCRECATHCKK